MMLAVLDVGRGYAILIRSPEGRTALADAGPSHDVVEPLRERGVTAPNLLTFAHRHADHGTGYTATAAASRPRAFLDGGSAHTTPRYLRLRELVRDTGIRVIVTEDDRADLPPAPAVDEPSGLFGKPALRETYRDT